MTWKPDRGDRQTSGAGGRKPAALYEVAITFTEKLIKKADLIATVHEAQQDTDQHSGSRHWSFSGL